MVNLNIVVHMFNACIINYAWQTFGMYEQTCRTYGKYIELKQYILELNTPP